jgi:hypothetical protein
MVTGKKEIATKNTKKSKQFNSRKRAQRTQKERNFLRKIFVAAISSY